MTYWAQHRGGAVVSAEVVGLSSRLANAAVAYVRYFGKFAWPTHLAVFYPRAQAIPLWHAAHVAGVQHRVDLGARVRLALERSDLDPLDAAQR